MNSMIRKSLGVLVIALACGTSAFANLTPYCIRVYCQKDSKTKIRTAEGHGMFLSAQYDSNQDAYLIPTNVYNRLVQQECHNNVGATLFGTNADKLETLASWVKVMSTNQAYALDPRCQSMEK
jgi:hypothetical protein